MTGISGRARRVLGDEETLRRWYVERGMSLADIARRIGVTGKTVSAALRRHGIPVRPAGGRRDPASLLTPDQLRQLHAKGLRTRQIAAAAGVDERLVRRALRAADLPAQGPWRRLPELLDYDWLLARADVPDQEIAVELGCSVRHVRRRRAEHGLSLPRRRPGTAARHQRLWDVTWLRAQLAAERTNRDIAAELGCSISYVNLAVRRGGLVGVRAQARATRQTERAAALRTAWVAGEHAPAIAERLGTTVAEVRRIARTLGLTKRPIDRRIARDLADVRARAQPPVQRSFVAPIVDPVSLDAFVTAVDAGEHVETAAERLGIPRHRAGNLYRAATGRTVAATRAAARERRLAMLAAAFDAGASLEEMTAIVGLSPASVATMLAVTGRRLVNRDVR